MLRQDLGGGAADFAVAGFIARGRGHQLVMKLMGGLQVDAWKHRAPAFVVVSLSLNF